MSRTYINGQTIAAVSPSGAIRLSNGSAYTIAESAKKFASRFKEGDIVDIGLEEGVVAYIATPKPRTPQRSGPSVSRPPPTERATPDGALWIACLSSATSLVCATPNELDEDSVDCKRILLCAERLYLVSVARIGGESVETTVSRMSGSDGG